MICPHCQSARVSKNGHTPRGRQNYRCFGCNRQFLENAHPVVYSAATKAIILRALTERMSVRGAERTFHVSRQKIATWLEEAAADGADDPPKAPPVDSQIVLELDETWRFIGRRKANVWLWVALERRTRRIIGWVSGDRSEKTAQQLWERLPAAYRAQSHCYTDFWRAYACVVPPEHHTACGKEQGQTTPIERWNTTLRQRVGRFVRDTLSFSKCARMHVAALTWFIHCYNLDH